jgi:hypothetical protein
MRIGCFSAVLLIAVCVITPLCSAGDWRDLTPLPDDVSIEPVPADPSLSPKIGKLSGVWHGEWQLLGSLGAAMDSMAGIPTTVVIEKIFGKNVQAILSDGAYQSAKPGWVRALGTVEGDRIVFRMGPKRAKMTLRLVKENAAFAEWEENAFYFRARLERKAISLSRAEGIRGQIAGDSLSSETGGR